MTNLAEQWVYDRTPETLGPDPTEDVGEAARSDREEALPQKSAGAALAAAYRSNNFGAASPVATQRPAPVSQASVACAPAPFRPARAAATDRDFSTFVGKNEDAFAKCYAVQRAGERWRRAISWPALFVPVAWLMYRKMYVPAAAVIVTPLVLNMLHCPPGVARGLMYWTLPLAGYGRHIYVWHARRKIAEIRASAADETTALDAMRRAGGVSRAGAALGVALSATFVLNLPLAHHP